VERDEDMSFEERSNDRNRGLGGKKIKLNSSHDRNKDVRLESCKERDKKLN
jgi:hypothetical protein